MIERLNKYLAFHLGVSRREADLLIEQKRVRINGDVAPLGARLKEGDTVSVNNEPVTKRAAFTYLAFHKPAGYVCSRKQQGDNETLYVLLPSKYHDLKPVGRLDKDSSGLILLTNDGDFAYHMTHPKFYKVKNYEVSLNKALEPLHQQMISDFGIALEDGPSKLSLERRNDARTEWGVTMHEGRNRQIRRTFDTLGYDVTALHRTSFGPYALGNLPAGSFEIVDKRS